MMACWRLLLGWFSMRLSFFFSEGFLPFCSISWTSCWPCEPSPLISLTSTSVMSILRPRLFLLAPAAVASGRLSRSTPTSTSRSSTLLEKRECVNFEPVYESAFFSFLPPFPFFFLALSEPDWPPLEELFSLTVSSNSTSRCCACLSSYWSLRKFCLCSSAGAVVAT